MLYSDAFGIRNYLSEDKKRRGFANNGDIPFILFTQLSVPNRQLLYIGFEKRLSQLIIVLEKDLRFLLVSKYFLITMYYEISSERQSYRSKAL